MLMVNNIEKLLNSKLESFEKVVNEELENLIHHNFYLNKIIQQLYKELHSIKDL